MVAKLKKGWVGRLPSQRGKAALGVRLHPPAKREKEAGSGSPRRRPTRRIGKTAVTILSARSLMAGRSRKRTQPSMTP